MTRSTRYCVLCTILCLASWVTALSVLDRSAANPPVPAAVVVVAPPPAPLPIDVVDPVRNYTTGRGRHQYGSCLHAAVQDLLRWQGLADKADYWRAHYGGPADLADVERIADEMGLHHAATDQGDEAFFDYVTKNRLGAAIVWEVENPGDHAIVFCGYDAAGDAVLLGTNHPVLTRMPKTEFLRCWHRCGGWAFTILP